MKYFGSLFFKTVTGTPLLTLENCLLALPLENELIGTIVSIGTETAVIMCFLTFTQLYMQVLTFKIKFSKGIFNPLHLWRLFIQGGGGVSGVKKRDPSPAMRAQDDVGGLRGLRMSENTPSF